MTAGRATWLALFIAAAALAASSAFVQGCATSARGQTSAPHDTPGTSTGAIVSTGAPRRVDLAGSWKYLPYDGEGAMGATAIDDHAWPAMDLPSSWFLMGKREYPAKANALPRAFGNNAPGELWPVDPGAGLDYAGTVWFRRAVEWDGDGARPAVIDLDMVDYYAEVFVNGVSVGKHEGYFQRWSVDATRAMHRGSNLIAVRVSAPALTFDMAQQYAVSWPKMQNQVKGIFAYHDTRPGATSWRGQERSTGGILRGATLRESSGVDLTEVTVTPLDVSDASARLVVEATVHNWTSAPQKAALDGAIRGKTFTGDHPLSIHAEATVPPGISRVRTEVTADHPHLWWSWDYGTPDLYVLDARLTSLAAARAPLDARTVTFGVRSITRTDDWVLRLNGKRIYPRGTNYIGTQWLSQADRAFYERDLRLMIGANLNSIRVHAHLGRPELYDLADELGLLIWQDFPLQWGYTDLPSFHEEALRQAEDMVRQYGDHPSIVVWCMHNESPHAMTWMQHREPHQNLALDESLAALARKLDPSRVVHRDSGTGDGHYYYGWYDGKLGDAATAEVVPFVTEYGAAALPDVETLRSIFDEHTLWPATASASGDSVAGWENWQFADFQPKNTFGLAKVKRGRDIQEFVQNSQRYQAITVRYTTELLRRRKWTKSTGVYQFMFADDWPSITWSVVDYYRRPKLGYAALRSSMQRLLPSIAYDPHDAKKPITIDVVNDFVTSFDGAHVAWSVVDNGKTLLSGDRTLDIPADGVVHVADLGTVASLAGGHAHLDVTIDSAAGKRVADSHLGAEDFLATYAR